MAELHGGSVTVETWIGEGSTFRLQLKCAVETGAETAPLAALGGVRARVLVVEDNVVNQRVIGAVLRKWHYRIAIAEDGRKA